jgi:glucokinase
VERTGDAWSTLGRGQVPTEAREGPRAVVDRISATGANAVEAWPDVATVGIGVPGLYDPATGATRFLVNLPGDWAGQPVAGPVGEHLGRPAVLVNDARAFGLAELRLGAGRGALAMVGLTLGTGIGGVFAVGGQVQQGHDGTAGEVGHQTIDPDGPWCGCGNRGCLEAYARADQVAAACGTATAEEAIRAAEAGDARAIDGLAQVGRYLGIGIANMITVVSPDRVVLGGGIAAAGELLFAPIRAELRRRVRTTSLDAVELVAAELGTWAGAIGAAVHGAERAVAEEPVAAGVPA